MTQIAKRRIGIVAALLVAILLPLAVYFGIREYTRWREKDGCSKNLSTLALATHKYASQHGRLPPAYVLGKDGKPWHSWRVLLLPFLDQQALYEAYRFDEPWDGPNNSKLIDKMPNVFACPADNRRTPGKTSYLAITGSQTIWPGERSATLEEITSADGTANTMLLMETAQPTITWTEPRDISIQDLFPADEDVGPEFSSMHKGVVLMARADGSVGRIRNPPPDGAADRLFGAVTAWDGQPYKGKWLPGEQEREKERFAQQFPAEIPAGQLKSTDVVSHVHGPLSRERSAIWCATVQLAWDELRQRIGKAPEVDDTDLDVGLARSPFPKSALWAGSYLAIMGSASEGIQQRITEQLRSKFPDVTPPPLTLQAPTDVVLYSFLKKELRFETQFSSSKEALVFRAATGRIKVKSFGFAKLGDASRADGLKRQIKVLNYHTDDDFILRLSSRTDEIVLAKVDPAGSLGETLAAVEQRIGQSDNVRPELNDEESLAVPRLAFNLRRDYHELADKRISNFLIGGDAHRIHLAQQSVRFMLSNRGARVGSEMNFHMMTENGHEKPPPPPRVRKFMIDRPFLLYVKESDAPAPYLVAWVANGEIMQPVSP